MTSGAGEAPARAASCADPAEVFAIRHLFALLLSCCLPLAHAGDRAPAEVAVLATLHRMHAQVPAYDDAALKRSIERLAPDVLCIEVSPARYAARAAETNKVEYPAVIYPLIDARGYRVYPMEPAAPRDAEILQPYLAASRAFAEQQPAAAKAFQAQASALYDTLRLYWTSPARVNDAVTDAQMQAKHALQAALVGAGEQAGWEAWNGEFLATIARAAQEHPGKRIVVLVGAEHGYWLRAALARTPGLRLLDTTSLLAATDD